MQLLVKYISNYPAEPSGILRYPDWLTDCPDVGQLIWYVFDKKNNKKKKKKKKTLPYIRFVFDYGVMYFWSQKELLDKKSLNKSFWAADSLKLNFIWNIIGWKKMFGSQLWFPW